MRLVLGADYPTAQSFQGDFDIRSILGELHRRTGVDTKTILTCQQGRSSVHMIYEEAPDARFPSDRPPFTISPGRDGSVDIKFSGNDCMTRLANPEFPMARYFEDLKKEGRLEDTQPS